MKCTVCAFALLSISLLALPALALDFDLAPWSHVAPVELPSPPDKGLVELTLPPELLALARPDLADLRLITSSSQTIPFILRTDRGEEGHSLSYPPQRLFNPVFLPNKQSTVTVDFASRAARTRVDIDTPGTNFRRRVSIEASQDGDAWQVLRQSAWLFRIAYENGSYSKNDVSLPDNDFRFLRITVFNATDDPEQVPIRSVLAWDVKRTPPHTVEVPARSINHSQNADLKASLIEVDLGYENLPLDSLQLSFDDQNFLRRVEILGRNALTRTITEPVENAPPRRRNVDEPWSSITGGTIYRLPGTGPGAGAGGGEGQEPSTGLTLPLNGQYRYLLLRIFNADDAPLKFTGLKIQRLQSYMDFQPNPAGPYKIYFGNPDAQKPQFDLENFAGRLRSQGVMAASFGPISPNPLFKIAAEKTIPWSERNAWLLWVTLISVLILLALLILRQARRAKPLD